MPPHTTHDRSAAPPTVATPSPRADGVSPELSRSPSPWRLVNLVVPGIILWFDAVLVQSAADTLGVIAPTVAITGTLGLFLCLPLLARPFWFRSAIGILAVFFLVRLVQFPPQAVESGFIVVPRTLTVVLAEFSLSCQALLLWRWHSRDPLPIAYFCVGIATGVFALNKTLPVGTQGVYVVLVTAALLLPILLATRSTSSSRAGHQPLPWNARLVLILVGGSVLTGTWVATEAWSRWLPDAQSWFASKVRNIASDNMRLRYYATAGLLTTVRDEQTFNPNRIALSVYSKDRPGYLAGRIFDLYESSHWRIASDIGGTPPKHNSRELRILEPLDPVPKAIDRPTGANNFFEINDYGAPGSLRRMAIENDPRRGSVFFTPRDCRYVLGRGDWIAVDDHDIIRAGFNVHAPYEALVDTTNTARPLSNQQQQELLIPLTGLQPRLVTLAATICRRTNTTRGKVRAIRNYFHNNYQYSLESVKVPQGVDPLDHFLLSKHAAHCEFFASGAVALLRLQGIPARYATGYCVMQLEDEDDDYWVARNKDAHAWAEAYDAQQQQWIVVEATPGFLDPNLDDLLGDENANGAQGPSMAFTSENASAIARWWNELPPPIRNALTALFVAVLGLILFLSVRRSHRSQAARSIGESDPRVQRWQQMLRRMDQRLKRRGIVRKPAETLHQFAQRIRALANPDAAWPLVSADWYIEYADTRFRPTAANPPALPPRRLPRKRTTQERMARNLDA